MKLLNDGIIITKQGDVNGCGDTGSGVPGKKRACANCYVVRYLNVRSNQIVNI